MPPVLVRNLMTTKIVTLFAEQTLPLAEDLMTLKHIRHVPVIDSDSCLLGLVSHRDLLKAQISSLAGLSEAERRKRQQEVKIEQLMTRDVWTVGADVLASVAGRTLLDHRYGCLPVVDHNNHLIGIVTERDFLKFAIKVIEMSD